MLWIVIRAPPMIRVPIPSPVGGACSKVLPSGKAFANDRTPTAEELKKLIGDDLRLKVIICIMTSCGIRVGAWNYLKVKHITSVKIKAKKSVYESFPACLLGGLKEEKYLINNKNLHK